MSKGGSAPGEIVEVRSLDLRVSRESQVAVAEIIGDNDDDVGLFAGE